MASKGICALCKQERQLQNSHIVPSFFGAYLKKTSATGYLRSGENPNLRLQDLPKEKMLCGGCEGRLAVWEKDFKENVLPVVQGDGFKELRVRSSAVALPRVHQLESTRMPARITGQDSSACLRDCLTDVGELAAFPAWKAQTAWK
jgi:hypothetical protein